MVQIQKLIFHILKDFKEAVCEYRLFSIFYARSASWISAPTYMSLTCSYDILKKINSKKLGTYHYYSYICNVNIGQNY